MYRYSKQNRVKLTLQCGEVIVVITSRCTGAFDFVCVGNVLKSAEKCYIENEGNATLSMDDIYYYSINNPLLLANTLFGNYRLPIKIYYICSYTVDETKCPAVVTVFLV